MKKMMLIAAMMVATLTANAQFEPGTFSIQPKIGGTITSVSNQPNFDLKDFDINDVSLKKDLNAGFTIGAEAEYQLTNMFSLAAGVSYAIQGCKWKDASVNIGDLKGDIYDTKIDLGYINVPVVANIYLFKGFAVKAGVQFGFLTSANFKASAKYTLDNTTHSESEDINIKEYMNKFDIAIPVGISYQVPTLPIVIDARYNIGMKDIYKSESLEAGEKNSKNGAFMLTVGYKFAL